jgi:hypothetical protein
MVADPIPLGEFENLGPFETACCGQVEILESGLERKTGRLDAAVQAVVGSAGDLDIDQ